MRKITSVIIISKFGSLLKSAAKERASVSKSESLPTRLNKLREMRTLLSILSKITFTISFIAHHPFCGEPAVTARLLLSLLSPVYMSFTCNTASLFCSSVSFDSPDVAFASASFSDIPRFFIRYFIFAAR